MRIVTPLPSATELVCGPLLDGNACFSRLSAQLIAQGDTAWCRAAMHGTG